MPSLNRHQGSLSTPPRASGDTGSTKASPPSFDGKQVHISTHTKLALTTPNGSLGVAIAQILARLGLQQFFGDLQMTSFSLTS